MKLKIIKKAKIEELTSNFGKFDEFHEFICWMAMSKNTLKTRSLFDNQNKSINLLEKILTKYSHSKLKELYSDQNIAVLFSVFFEKGTKGFLRDLPKEKRNLYKEAIIEMNTKFGAKGMEP